MPAHVKQLILNKAKVKPFHKSVLKFRDIMTRQSCSPLDKLFMLKDLKD